MLRAVFDNRHSSRSRVSSIVDPALSTLFQHGISDGHAVLMASKLAAFAIGITPFMLVKVLSRGFLCETKYANTR